VIIHRKNKRTQRTAYDNKRYPANELPLPGNTKKNGQNKGGYHMNQEASYLFPEWDARFK